MQPLPDTTGFQFTPTLHTAPPASLHPSNNTLPHQHSYTVAILGASKGIGYHIARAYALAGASDVFLVGRNETALWTAEQELETDVVQRQEQGIPMSGKRKAKFHIVEADTASASAMASLAKEITAKSPNARLDTVVINAAYYGPMTTSVLAGSPSDFAQVLNTNVLGAYHAAHYLLPLMLSTQNGGKTFIAISSLGAWMTKGEVAHTAACVSKLAQVRLIEMVAEEFREQGVLSVAVHPGFVPTDMSSVVDDEWRKFLTDDPLLCGSICTWLSSKSKSLQWLSGRFLNAKWDGEELVKMKDSIVGKDMLKARMVVS